MEEAAEGKSKANWTILSLVGPALNPLTRRACRFCAFRAGRGPRVSLRLPSPPARSSAAGSFAGSFCASACAAGRLTLVHGAHPAAGERASSAKQRTIKALPSRTAFRACFFCSFRPGRGPRVSLHLDRFRLESSARAGAASSWPSMRRQRGATWPQQWPHRLVAPASYELTYQRIQ